MDLVESDNDSEEQTTQTAKRVGQTTTETQPSGVAWIRVVGLIFLAIILIALVVLFARWVYHKAHHATVNAPAVTTQQQLKSSASNTENGAESSGSSSSTASGSSTSGNSSSSGSPASGSTGSSSSASQPNQSSSQNNKLPNNGPGNVAAVFIGTSLVAAGIHYVVTNRRLNRQGA